MSSSLFRRMRLRRPASVLRRRREKKEAAETERQIEQLKSAKLKSEQIGEGGGKGEEKRSEVIPQKNTTTAPVMVRPPPPSHMGTKLHYKMDDIIRLNVGGQRFDTKLRTVLADRSNDLFAHFVCLMEENLTEAKLPARDSDGNFFLDRDPEHFRTLLNNLRFYVHLQEKQKLASGTNGRIDDDEDVRSTKSVGFLGRLLKS